MSYATTNASKTLGQQLDQEVKKIFRESWSVRDGQVVPESEDLQLGNDAVRLDGTVLYADLDGSTDMVNKKKAEFAAEIYKSYLHCAAKIIRDEGGVITAYDGDRIMAVFIGGSKNTSAVRTAMKINYAVSEIINPAIKQQYQSSDFQLRQAVGVDTSSLLVARTGIRGANDLVWVGRSANYAAKLCSMPGGNPYPSVITADVYNVMDRSLKYSKDGQSMWEINSWAERQMTVYGSTWWWKVS
jgi:class 3 adenylate cyclase